MSDQTAVLDQDVVRISTNNDLYVISSEEGVSTLGFHVCDRWSAALCGFLLGLDARIRLPAPADIGTLEHYARYRELCRLAQEQCRERGRFCPILLEPQLVGLEGKKVEVKDRYGDTRRFVVGRSSGWMPVHIELERARDIGGPPVMGTPFQKVRVLEYARVTK